MAAIITLERPDSADAQLLIAELEAILNPNYPPESRHGLSVERLLAEAVAFYVLRWEQTPAGCAGLKHAPGEYGEVKRMYVRPHFRRRGFAKRLLEQLEADARHHNLPCLRLETGIHQQEAIALYEQMGFRCIPPFGPYWDDPVSLCYEKRL